MHFPKTAALCALSALPAIAQFTYPGCPNLTSNDFDMTELFNRTGGALATNANLTEPVALDLRGIYSGGNLTSVDVYFVERTGAVKYFNGAARTVTQLGSIPVWGQADNGLMGIAVDPNFTATRLLYFWYSPPIANSTLNRRLRLSRIPVATNNTLTMGSEQIMIDILASKTDQWHSGGPMHFDSYGDLWITVGNNSRDVEAGGPGSHYSTTDSSNSAEWGPSNTASMRGGILRIHPEPNLVNGKYYTIPSGNFGEYWATQFQNQGNAALATQYRNPALVLPELYVKGSRSNFSISLHPTRRWLAWAEVNYQSTNDEFMITNRPIFGGFPYFHANNANVPGNTKTVAAPTNTNPINSGVTTLPPAIPGTINNLMNVAIGGPIYVYDRNNPSTTKFPPHLHNTWGLMGFSANQLHMTRVDSINVTVSGTQRVDNGIFNGLFTLRNPIAAKYGPDGSLYILNYSGFYSTTNPGLMRVDYIGTCALTPVEKSRGDSRLFSIQVGLDGLTVNEPGRHVVGLYDLAGKKLFSAEGATGAEYSFSGMRERSRQKTGVYVIRVKTERGLFTRNLSLF